MLVDLAFLTIKLNLKQVLSFISLCRILGDDLFTYSWQLYLEQCFLALKRSSVMLAFCLPGVSTNINPLGKGQ